jgi:NADP-dependent 3-hydroxy acid dehydrogenase YdfG
LAKQGVDLILTSRNRADLNVALQAVQNTGRTAHALSADLNQHADVVRLGEEALRIWPALDILVNNAGVNVLAPAAEAAVEDWDVMLNTNLRAPSFLRKKSRCDRRC